MEKKKAILIAVIAGLFLVIVVAFPLMILSSKDKTASAATGIPQLSAAQPQQPASIDINDLVNKTAVPATTPAQNVVINNFDNKSDISESSTVRNPDGTITINVLPRQAAPAQPASQEEQSPQPPSAAPPKPADAAPQSPPAKPAETPKAAAKPVDAPKPAEAPKAAAKPAEPAKTAAKPAGKPAETPKAAAKPAEPAKTAAKPAVPKKQPAPKTADVDHWVQAGFFSTQAIADNAKAALKNRGITAVIKPASVNGRNGFRLRIGPFTNNDEASYWLKLIREMDGFTESYISETKR